MIKELSQKYLEKTFELHYRSIVPMWLRLGREHDRKGIIDYMKFTFKKGKVFGYFIDEELIGIIGIVPNRKHKYAEVEHVLVDEKHQGKGIGKELMNFIEKYTIKKYKFVKELRLNVLVKNPAVNFYEHLGYDKKSYNMIKKLKQPPITTHQPKRQP